MDYETKSDREIMADIMDAVAELEGTECGGEPLASLLRAAASRLMLWGDPRRDALLFRFWIKEAAERPERCARFLSGCTTPEDYRTALERLMMAGR